MNILVCVKQIPDQDKIKFNGTVLDRTGEKLIINPFDSYAMEAAALLKDKIPGTKITVLTMGPDQAKNVLRECVSVGADNAYLLCDEAFAESDTLGTAKILAAGIEKISEKEGPIDVVFLGKQSLDGGNAQMGPMLAEYLSCAQVIYAVNMEEEEPAFLIKREIDGGYANVKTELPCVITVGKAEFDPRFPTIRTKMAANRVVINVLTAEDINLDASKIGAAGRKVEVLAVEKAPEKGACVMVGSAADLAAKLYETRAI